jgi:uncharacterized membrane protein YdfJ with MMPL/SSD domain
VQSFVLSRTYALTVVGLRWLIIGGWIAAVVFAVRYLPPLSSSGGLSDLIPAGSAAAHAEADAARLFGFPLDPAVTVVQRDPRGPGSRAVLAVGAVAGEASLPLRDTAGHG